MKAPYKLPLRSCTRFACKQFLLEFSLVMFWRSYYNKINMFPLTQKLFYLRYFRKYILNKVQNYVGDCELSVVKKNWTLSRILFLADAEKIVKAHLIIPSKILSWNFKHLLIMLYYSDLNLWIKIKKFELLWKLKIRETGSAVSNVLCAPITFFIILLEINHNSSYLCKKLF